MRLRMRTAATVYICWSCGEDFGVTERDGLTDDLEVACPGCGSDLVSVDHALSLRLRPRTRPRPVPANLRSQRL